MYNLIRSCQTVVQSGCIILPSHQQWIEFQVLSILTNVYVCVFVTLVILVGVKWYLVALLICISQMTNNIKHLCMSLFVIHTSFRNSLFKSFYHFYLGFSSYYRCVEILYIYYKIQLFFRYIYCEYFLPWLAFSFP